MRATSAAPLLESDILNGKPVVHFSGNGGYFTLPNVMGVGGSSPATAGEIIMVLRAASNSGGGEYNRGLYEFGTATSAGFSFYPYSNGTIWDDFGSTSQHDQIASDTDITQFNL